MIERSPPAARTPGPQLDWNLLRTFLVLAESALVTERPNGSA
jgi:hypothetical protein